MLTRRGVTLIELLVVLAVVSIITAISVSVFSGLSNSTSLDRDANIVLSYISKARTKAIDSVNSMVHGTSFSSSGIKVFEGTTISSSNTRETFELGGAVSISSINLSNGTTSLYFNKLTGSPSATGNITLSLGEETKTIVIYATGIAEIQ